MNQNFSKNFQDYFFTLLSILLSLIVFFYFIYNSDVGLDISDSSFYLINIYSSFDINIQLTMFGILWESVFGTMDVVSYRAINISMLFAVGYLITYRCTLFFADASALARTYLSVAGGTCYLFYFSWFILDPSYNSLTILFLSLGWLSFVWIAISSKAYSRFLPLFAASICFGMAMSGLTLVKATSTVSSGSLMAAIYLLYCWRTLKLKSALIVISGGTLGIAIVVCWLWLHGYSPIWLFESLQRGLEYMGILLTGRHPPLYHEVRQIQIYSGYVIQTFSIHGLPTMLWMAIMISGLTILNKAESFRSGSTIAVIVGALVTAIWFWFNWSFFTSSELNENLAALNLICLCNFVFGAFTLALNRKRIPGIALISFPVLLVAPLLVSSRTGIGWQYSFLLSMGLIFAVTLSCTLSYKSSVRLLAHIPVFALIAAGVFAGWARTEYQAYRLGDNLSNATVKFELGERKEILRAPASLAGFYLKLAPYRYKKQATEEKPPVLIDLSGRSPGASLQLGLRPPRTAWNLSGYAGSDNALAYVLEMLTNNELERAWVIEWDDSTPVKAPRLSRDVINQFLSRVGKQFPDDYEMLTGFDVPYAQSRALLYRPKVAD